jgi:hypothetical protein
MTGAPSITLPASTVAELRAHWRAQQERRLALGPGKAPEDSLVFATWDGQPRSPNVLTSEWTRTMKAAKLTTTLHRLRHTHASTLIASGLDVLTISRRLGHGSPAITLSVYGHLFKTDDRRRSWKRRLPVRRENETSTFPVAIRWQVALSPAPSSANSLIIQVGRVAERFKAAVLKCSTRHAAQYRLVPKRPTVQAF